MKLRATIAAFIVTISISMTIPGTATARAMPDRAEIFATNETASSFDPNDPALRTRLVRFGRQVETIIRQNGGSTHGSTLLNGTFWSSDLKKADYERSREFHVGHADAAEIHAIAHQIAVRFHQQSVLTFRYLPKTSPSVDAVLVEVPDVDFQRLHDALEADPVLGERLGGGSVTLDRRLIEAGARSDLSLIRQLVAEARGDWTKATIRYGTWEFVS